MGFTYIKKDMIELKFFLRKLKSHWEESTELLKGVAWSDKHGHIEIKSPTFSCTISIVELGVNELTLPSEKMIRGEK